MPPAQSASGLTPARRHLVDLMQRLNHGRIENLRVRDGQPRFDPPPTTYRLYRFGKPNGPNQSSTTPDFSLKRGVAELLRLFDSARNLDIESLKIEDGLPVAMSVTEEIGA